MRRDDLIRFLDEYLDVPAVAGKDYCPNGLQVEGAAEVRHIVCGVTACHALIAGAAERNADTVLVHHGILWGGAMPTITRSFKARVKALFDSDLNLLAYHLPLDRHPEVGNAVTVARRLGLTALEPFGEHRGLHVGIRGRFEAPLAIDGLARRVAESLSADGIVFPFGEGLVSTVGIVTGAADKELPQALTAGLDCFLTGEISEYVMHFAREESLHFIAAGHHNTERYGVQALAAEIERRFGVTWEFLDVPNPA